MKPALWKIIYNNYTGPEKRAVELVAREMGEYLLREDGIYAFHLIACEQEAGIPDQNAVILGTYAQSPLLRQFLSPGEVPENGYVVKIIDHPVNSDLQLVLICGDGAREVFYGAVDFVDDGFNASVPDLDGFKLPHELFRFKLAPYYIATAPAVKTRSVFTWGHTINNREAYFANLARMKLNQVMVWNEHKPINAEEVVECAHSYGIEILWGYAWGWSTNCGTADLKDLDTLKDQIIREYNDFYHGSGDGIYFQSFTEIWQDTIGGVLISEAVTRLVNMTASELLKQYPNLKLQFGLHASSVKNHMEHLAKVDPRIEIIWENCGDFPYTTSPTNYVQCNLEQDIAYTDEIITLRGDAPLGLVYKGQVTQDWSRGRFVHQAGPYILGDVPDSVRAKDRAMLLPMWRQLQTEWLMNGRTAFDLTRHIQEKTGGNVNMCMAAQLSEGIWFPTALCAELFWNGTDSYEEILRKVISRHSVTMAN